MKKVLIVAIVVGLVITLITGLVKTTPPGLLGAIWYGWPFAWRIVLVTATPTTNYQIPEFIGDFVVWFVVAFVLMFLWKKLKK